MTWDPLASAYVPPDGASRAPVVHLVLLAIDPGPVQSAWLVYNPHTGGIRSAAIVDNEWLIDQLRRGLSPDVTRVVIEKVESFGMAVGAEVFETVFWSGRFAEAAHPLQVDRIGRKAIKIHLCGSARAKDPNIRQALLDRYGGPGAKGTKAQPGPLYGIANDLWSALAVAVTAGDPA
jgi:hypothetical protein